jgi:hypothetical protein
MKFISTHGRLSKRFNSNANRTPSVFSKNLSPNVLAELPVDIFWEICDFLSAKELANLQLSSYSIMNSNIFKDNRFWRARTKIDLPWIWGLHKELTNLKSNSSNWRFVYSKLMSHSFQHLWLPKQKQKTFKSTYDRSERLKIIAKMRFNRQDYLSGYRPSSDDIETTILGLSNQRRVWQICKQIIVLYQQVETAHDYPDEIPGVLTTFRRGWSS